MRTSLTKQQISDFEIEGIVKLPDIINDNLVEKLNQCFDWSVANPGPIAVGKPHGEHINFVDNGNPDAYQMYSDLVLESGFGHIAAELWDSEYVGFFAEEIFFKKFELRCLVLSIIEIKDASRISSTNVFKPKLVLLLKIE